MESVYLRRSAPAFNASFRSAKARGRDQPDSQIFREKDADVVGKDTAVRNRNCQFTPPDLAHADLVPHARCIRRDAAAQFDLADADRASLARRARPAEPIADHLPHGVETEGARHHRIAGKVTAEKPEIGPDIELADDMALAEFAAIRADFDDTVHHQHRRRRKLGIARPEIAALARVEQIFPAVGRLRRVEVVGVRHGGLTLAMSGRSCQNGMWFVNAALTRPAGPQPQRRLP